MKVQRTIDNESVDFKDVKLGDVFICGGNYYMRTVEKMEKGSNFKINAVDLERGQLTTFYDETPVRIIQVVLHIDD